MNSARLRTIVFIAAVGAIIPAAAGAYAVSDPSGQLSNPPITMPQVPIGTFSPNWTSFFNNLPIQSFISSLQSAAGGTVSGNSLPSLPAYTMPTGGQDVLATMDNWTSVHLGFRISLLITAILGIFSWVLGFVKAIIDWLIGFLK